MASGKITKRLVDVTSPGALDIFIWDEALKGFGLKVTPSGTKVYFVQYRMGGRESPTKRHSIGRHGSPWTATSAREEAARILQQVASGIDPRALEIERQRQAETLAFDQYAERFLRDYGLKRWRPSTYPTVASNIRRFAVPVLGSKPLPEISRGDLLSLFDRLPAASPALPRNVYSHLSRLFSWAVERGDVDRSPFEALKAPPSVPSRERVLTDDELRLMWAASELLAYPFGPQFRLLALTGQRRSEVGGLDWNELNRGEMEWTIPAERSKNKLVHIVPLSAQSISVLNAVAGGAEWPKSGLVFTTTGKTPASGHSRAKERIDKYVALISSGRSAAAWRIHDLRRTVATGLQRLGVRFEVTEAVLNHVSGSRRGVAGVYQRHNWREEKREALDQWGLLIESLINIPSVK